RSTVPEAEDVSPGRAGRYRSDAPVAQLHLLDGPDAEPEVEAIREGLRALLLPLEHDTRRNPAGQRRPGRIEHAGGSRAPRTPDVGQSQGAVRPGRIRLAMDALRPR